MRVFLVNPSHVSFSTAVITPRWLYVLAAATPTENGDPILCAVNVGLAWTEESLLGQFGAIADRVRPGVLSGSFDEVVDRIGKYVEAGADQVNLALRAPFDVDAIERFSQALNLA